MKTSLVTGSNGLIGSEMIKHFHALGWTMHGVDNNMRADFFGSQGDTRWNQDRLARECNRFTHHETDMRSRQEVLDLFRELRPQA
jgi:CDP-paratose 2-epimerase